MLNVAAIINAVRGAVDYQHYDLPPDEIALHPDRWPGLEYEPKPGRIPFLESLRLVNTAGFKQWGYRQAYHDLRMPPPPIPTAGRMGSGISLAFGPNPAYSLPQDTAYIPAVYVGWQATMAGKA